MGELTGKCVLRLILLGGQELRLVTSGVAIRVASARLCYGSSSVSK